MSPPRAVYLSEHEREVLAAALDYYLDTITRCSAHDDGDHGDELSCEGWGPDELALLEQAAKKVT